MECLAKFEELSAMTIEYPVFSDYVNCLDYLVLHVFLDRCTRNSLHFRLMQIACYANNISESGSLIRTQDKIHDFTCLPFNLNRGASSE